MASISSGIDGPKTLPVLMGLMVPSLALFTPTVKSICIHQLICIIYNKFPEDQWIGTLFPLYKYGKLKCREVEFLAADEKDNK